VASLATTSHSFWQLERGLEKAGVGGWRFSKSVASLATTLLFKSSIAVIGMLSPDYPK